MGLYRFKDKFPKVHSDAYISPRASLIGDVEVDAESSIWEFAVLRGDMNEIRIGKGTSIQDNASVHTTFDNGAYVGDYVTAGHNCVIHACEIGDNCLIGIGSIILTGAKIGEGSVIGAGAVVTEGTVIPPHSLVLGIPGKVVKEVPENMMAEFLLGAKSYIELGKIYRSQEDM